MLVSLGALDDNRYLGRLHMHGGAVGADALASLVQLQRAEFACNFESLH
jgi:hypothetical protein